MRNYFFPVVSGLQRSLALQEAQFVAISAISNQGFVLVAAFSNIHITSDREE